MTTDEPTRPDLPFRFLVSAASIVILIAGLRAAAEVLNPILLALLLALCISPALEALTSRGVKKALAVGIIVVAFLGIAIASTTIVAKSASGHDKQVLDKAIATLERADR